MKRSEMINHIQELLNQNGMQGLSTTANDVLSHIEQAGMAPPEVREPVTTYIIFPDGAKQVEDSTQFVRKWENE